ncbi:hypothetical protein [Bordetella sp. LUAb4]|uniref:hypothetical protein n=1 Tax=Bordetella sp. LUAb4 TaxID=2843195 RepID=UPI001E3FE868|nr:hypothetical protein [Bordetella sp. LUAb4]
MQRFLRDPRGHTTEASLDRAYGRPIALIRKHFSPSVAAVYAMPRLGDDGVLEWWTSQQGMVTPYAGLSKEAQQALLRAYDAHMATLDGLVEAMRARALDEQAGQMQALRTAPVLDKLYSVDGRLLICLADDPAPPPVAAARPAPRPRRWWRIALSSLLLLALLLGALWWWLQPHVALPPVVAAPTPAPEPKPKPLPPPEPEPARDPEWPTELVMVLESGQRMKTPPKTGTTPRLAIGRAQIERIVGGLPKDTVTQLVTFPAGECRAPEGHGVFPADKRPDLVKAMQGGTSEGKAALGEGLKLAAASVDGIKRDALVFIFLAGEDACGQDLCAVAGQIAQQKPKLRINVVDLSGTHSLAQCVSAQTKGRWYAWQPMKPGEKGVDLSKEASKMLAPAKSPGK